MKRSIISTLVLLVLAAAALAQVAAPEVPDEERQGYLLGPGDKIVGKVMGEDDFDFEVVIDEEGRFELPFVDTVIDARCRTEREVREEVREHYSKYLRDPLISVRVTERRKPTPVTVSGAIVRPGQIELRREARLLELLTFSGDVTDEAGGIVKVFRTQIPLCSDEETVRNWRTESDNGRNIPFNLYRLSNIKAGIKESNPIIRPGDIIVVDRALPVYFTGEVRAPQGVYIKEGGLSLTQAIAMVGGTLDKAQTSDIRIYRLKGENPTDRETISINYKEIQEGTADDIMLQPYDIIDIDRKKKSIAQTIFEVVAGAGRTAVQSIATGGGARILY